MLKASSGRKSLIGLLPPGSLGVLLGGGAFQQRPTRSKAAASFQGVEAGKSGPPPRMKADQGQLVEIRLRGTLGETLQATGRQIPAQILDTKLQLRWCSPRTNAPSCPSLPCNWGESQGSLCPLHFTRFYLCI